MSKNWSKLAFTVIGEFVEPSADGDAMVFKFANNEILYLYPPYEKIWNECALIPGKKYALNMSLLKNKKTEKIIFALNRLPRVVSAATKLVWVNLGELASKIELLNGGGRVNIGTEEKPLWTAFGTLRLFVPNTDDREYIDMPWKSLYTWTDLKKAIVTDLWCLPIKLRANWYDPDNANLPNNYECYLELN